MFIAIISKNLGDKRFIQRVTERKAFSGPCKEALIQEVLQTKAEWERAGLHGPYRLFVGELSGEIVVPSLAYTEVPIKEGE